MTIRKFMLLSFVGAGLTIPAYIFAQNEQQQMAMDDAQDAKDDLLDAVNAKDTEKAVAAVDKMTKIILDAKKFWADQKQADVVKMADDTLAAAANMTAVAKAKGDFKAAYQKLDLSCQQCHNVHPENRLKK
jgi:hypothetical protein